MQMMFQKMNREINKVKSVLIVGIGTSPEVLTTTIQSLCLSEESIIPDEVIVITTLPGKKYVENLIRNKVIWEKMLSNLRKNNLEIDGKIKFGATNSIRVLNDGERDFDDISTPYECNESADRILEIIRTYTEAPNTRVIASIAGGRKSLSALLLSCMTLLGREQDKVFHVFIDENKRKELPKLAEISFVRVRGWVNHHLKSSVPSYMQLVRQLENSIPVATNYSKLFLNIKDKFIKVNNVKINLSSREFGFVFLCCYFIKIDKFNSFDWFDFMDTELNKFQYLSPFLENYCWFSGFVAWCSDKNQDDMRVEAGKIRRKLKKEIGEKISHQMVPMMRTGRELYPKKYIIFSDQVLIKKLEKET